ncbi:transcriptional regulator [Solihabitans fulvus]|uniref:Transcriptional regulator n=2 Tax=Solihabitans fulvus TaxID=1892852 RepID=A0A5B2WTQ0_9PSEU|nr:transcriptional regulator [Solihabitans fulvus]
MRASRLLSLLLLLQTRGRMTGQQLAEELEVSVRTVYRDVESLSAAGVPVYADRGASGGFQLLDGYRTKLTGLTGGEAESLFFAGMPGPAAELGLGAVLAAAELKLLAALPPELRSRAGRIRERFHLDAAGWFHEADRVPWLTEIADAVWNQRRIELHYQRWGQPREVTRLVDPLGIVLKAGKWYLVASAEEKIRTYRVAKVLDARITDENFDRPPDFDLDEYWRSWAERFEASVYQGEMVVRISPRGLARLPHLVAQPIARAALATAGEPDEDGWVRVVLPTESINHARVDLLKLAEDAEVLEPPELRADLERTIVAMAELYGAPDS